ncbi:zinc finger, CCHC-type containing protein [Tanacetum coccineum]
MLVEKEYPLSRGTLTQMLVAKLLVEKDNEMSRELLRKIFMQELKVYILSTTKPIVSTAQVTTASTNQLVLPEINKEEGQSVSSYHLKMKSYLDTLERLGYAMPNELGVSLILNSLNKDYDQFEGKIHKDKKKPQKAKGKDKGKNKLAYAPNPKIPSSPKRDNPKKDYVYHHCKKVGHWKRNCPSYQAELKKRKNASIASTSGIFTIELYAFPNKTWVYDTGYGTHICDTSQGLKGSMKLKHGALSLYIGKGMRAAVEAIRSFDLVLPSGLIIILDNYHFAPTIIRGVVSISRLVNVFYEFWVSERRNRTLLDMVRSMMNLTTLPKSFWGYALESVVRILNIVPTKKVEMTPYEIWYGKAPKLSYLRVWGCETLVKQDTSVRIPQAPDRYDFNVDVGEYELGDLNEPLMTSNNVYFIASFILFIEYLVKVSRSRAFWSVNEDILKITILNTPYLSRKIRRIHACTGQRPQRKEDQYAVSRRCQYAVLKI